MVALFFFSVFLWPCHCLPSSLGLNEPVSTPKVSKVVERLRGRYFGKMIRKGMDAKQVTRILGPSHIDSAVRTGATNLQAWHFVDNGVVIRFMPDDQEMMRVIDIAYFPIFE